MSAAYQSMELAYPGNSHYSTVPTIFLGNMDGASLSDMILGKEKYIHSPLLMWIQ